jgi:hypothetical protein
LRRYSELDPAQRRVGVWVVVDVEGIAVLHDELE